MNRSYDYLPGELVRFWAWLDFVFGLAMALPPLAYGLAKLIFTLNRLIGGTAAMPVFAPVHWLMVFISGVFILNWAVIRLLHPIGLFAIIDGFIKLWLSVLLIYTILVLGAAPILWTFAITAATGAVLQLGAAYWKRPAMIAAG